MSRDEVTKTVSPLTEELPRRLERLARLLRLGSAPPFSLVVLAPDGDLLVDVHADSAPDAQTMLLGLTVRVNSIQEDADRWSMITELSEASSVGEENDE